MAEKSEKITNLQKVEFIRRIHLFYKLEDDQFDAVAGMIHEETFQAGEVIFRQGQVGHKFFIIYSGSVEAIRRDKRGRKTSEGLVAEDYFGEESLVTRNRRNATVTAKEESVLLTLLQRDFKQLLRKVPQLKANFAIAINSHRLACKMDFTWLRKEEGEVIYFLARKHPILLVGVLLLPVTLGMLALLGTVIGFTAQITWLLWLSVPVLGFMISLGVWNGVDWGNDYYIVTNQRVVWLEKVIGIYDSRQESPLSAIQRINVLTDFWGRQMDYGSLVVRTIVGSTLTLRNVNHPYQAAALIEDHWKRSQQSTRKMEEAAMRQALRERLIPKSADPMPAPPPSLFQQAEPKRVDIYGTPHGLGNIFRVRFEDLSTITYRKHWIVLIEKIWLSSLILLTLLGWLVYEITHISSNAFPTLIRNSSVGAFLILWLIIFLIIFGWWYYQYLDWSNDIFKVTPDQIMDIYKKPLAEVTSDIASLDNILHLEYAREGIFQVLFNYGNVYITIGGGNDMTFSDLYNPSAVQDDIERRRLERITKKEQASIKADRERMADWFASYHHSAAELRKAEAKAADSNKSGVNTGPDEIGPKK